ncbi:PTS sugar transporter subunit IIA [Virgibacillus doumboii]|uniref:PTS sugar transporter subunit IIA n=1 Tax=Virgibacillus doumboii TaxID=2697503 RepID=UPI0013E013C3|nr:fructose PTS transporter subunit IIA [Virgibacillus doumboii]
MQHNQVITKDLIEYKTELSSKEEIFEKIASLAIEQGIANDKEAIIKGLFKREEESTTGFFDGFAIPHTKQSSITEAGIVILVNDKGIEWDSMDGQPAHFFISLLIPDQEAGSTHLKMLSTISKMLMDEDVRMELSNAKSSGAIYDIINNFLNENMD